jgi:uracil-DNA glycosylase family 4
MAKVALSPAVQFEDSSVWQPLKMDQTWPASVFDVHCASCPRLCVFHEKNRGVYPDHFNGPVPPFGELNAEVLIVGLAPGLHGANRTGRPFTGDYCGSLLYSTLHRFGFASHPESRHVQDGMRLINARVSNAVKCVPPENKPTPAEIKTCNRFLSTELRLHPPKAILALGTVAHQSVIKAFGAQQSAYKFGHGAQHALGEFRLFDSYHVSRYNTQTKRLTVPMFEAVLQSIAEFIGSAHGTAA